MDEDSIMIGVVIGVLVLLSPVMLYWTVALLDTSGIDRYLPGALFVAVSALIPVLIVCSLSYLVMRHYNRPREWIKKKLTLVALFLFAALFMLLSIMGAV
ncbi:hypothetical protein GQS_07600 [Thermococcus sp. 4557]|uniref:hypothetical protein n=1 Tax=Thermococcus sp. (strain CGMCC 1.5172 / 4557) TaxID=1042877 RepID=UPI000219EC18|nr:hypothetical protein [Thermococcus sp. 4557]AEK73418.1 hypothetical protein GQS_07600 [Thermococcus sp. 4557]